MVPGQRLHPWGESDTLQPAAGQSEGSRKGNKMLIRWGVGFSLKSSDLPLRAPHLPPIRILVPLPPFQTQCLSSPGPLGSWTFLLEFMDGIK